MRIALFTETFLPKTDGIVTRLTHTVRHLVEAGDDVLVVAPGPGDGEHAGAAVHRGPGGRPVRGAGPGRPSGSGRASPEAGIVQFRAPGCRYRKSRPTPLPRNPRLPPEKPFHALAPSHADLARIVRMLADSNEVRSELVTDIRTQMDDGSYMSDEKLNLAIYRMLTDILEKPE